MFFTSTGRLIVDYFLLGSLTVRLSGTVFYLISTDTAACGGFAAEHPTPEYEVKVRVFLKGPPLIKYSMEN